MHTTYYRYTGWDRTTKWSLSLCLWMWHINKISNTRTARKVHEWFEYNTVRKSRVACSPACPAGGAGRAFGVWARHIGLLPSCHILDLFFVSQALKQTTATPNYLVQMTLLCPRGSQHNESGDCCVTKAYFYDKGIQSQPNNLPNCDKINIKYKCKKIECAEKSSYDTGTCTTGECTMPTTG